MQLLKMFKASLTGWAASLAILWLFFSLSMLWNDSGTLTLQAAAHTLLLSAFYSAIIAIPTCFTASCLVRFLLRPSSRLWRPSSAAKLGALCGTACPLVIGLVFGTDYTTSKSDSSAWWIVAAIAASAGAACGYSLAKQFAFFPGVTSPSPSAPQKNSQN